MNNFPTYKHFAIKLRFPENVEVDERSTERLAVMLIKALGLHQVRSMEYVADNGELARSYVLADSQLAVHAWPNQRAVYMSLMTKRTEISQTMVEQAAMALKAADREIVELE